MHKITIPHDQIIPLFGVLNFPKEGDLYVLSLCRGEMGYPGESIRDRIDRQQFSQGATHYIERKKEGGEMWVYYLKVCDGI